MFASVASAAAVDDNIPGEPAILNDWTAPFGLNGDIEAQNDAVYSVRLTPGDQITAVSAFGEVDLNLFPPTATNVDVIESSISSARILDSTSGFPMVTYKVPTGVAAGNYYVDAWAPPTGQFVTITDRVRVTVRPFTQLRLDGPATQIVSYGERAGISCTLLDGVGAPLPIGVALVVTRSVNDGPGEMWSTIPAAPLATKAFTEPIYTKTSYTLYQGDPSAQSSQSVIKTVIPKVALSTPVAPAKVKKSKRFSVHGSLRPLHTKGTKPVRIYRYRKVKNKWKSEGFVMATAANDKSGTRYKANLKLTKKGKWRLRAYAPADAQHAATWSTKYDNVTVK